MNSFSRTTAPYLQRGLSGSSFTLFGISSRKENKGRNHPPKNIQVSKTPKCCFYIGDPRVIFLKLLSKDNIPNIVGKLLTIGQSVNNALINSIDDNSRRLQTQRDVQRARSAVGASPGERNYANAKMLPGAMLGCTVPCRAVLCRAVLRNFHEKVTSAPKSFYELVPLA
ncbi:hypothetical protein V1477_016346 [Vespula maculifrons]|uniref:Uncharacterized protein n=1 Tax=Vespula maculifrons TaxID=7453 RepID=A0ABD2BCT9_VESMC